MVDMSMKGWERVEKSPRGPNILEDRKHPSAAAGPGTKEMYKG